MRALKLAGLLALSVVIFAACGPSGTDNIKVAILAPLSGPVPTFGVMTRDGALLAIEEWNGKGGVLNKKLAAVVEDSQCTPDPAVNAANKVIDQYRARHPARLSSCSGLVKVASLRFRSLKRRTPPQRGPFQA